MYFALAILVAASGPLHSNIGQRWFQTLHQCEEFIIASVFILENERTIRSALVGETLTLITGCYQVGLPV